MGDIILSREGGVVEIRFNRPDKKNAFSQTMYDTMSEAIEAAGRDDGVRVVLFSAEGDFFSAGNDLTDFAAVAASPDTGRAPRSSQRFLEALIGFEKPFVAAVQGSAVGVGTTMLFHCDLVYVAETAKLTTPFVNLGLVAEAGSSFTIPARIGHAKAFAMFALGEPIWGRDAADLGLANAVLPAEDVLARARAAAQAVAQKPPEAVRITKALMRDREGLLKQMRYESELFGERLKSPEAKAAFEAFFARR
jgi:enoyl-CoA hydratase/carnithine racemase